MVSVSTLMQKEEEKIKGKISLKKIGSRNLLCSDSIKLLCVSPRGIQWTNHLFYISYRDYFVNSFLRLFSHLPISVSDCIFFYFSISFSLPPFPRSLPPPLSCSLSLRPSLFLYLSLCLCLILSPSFCLPVSLCRYLTFSLSYPIMYCTELSCPVLFLSVTLSL